MNLSAPQQFHPTFTTWHMTWGTYGARQHGSARPTVDKTHNELDTPFLEQNRFREKSARDRMKFPPMTLTLDQRLLIEDITPSVCDQGGWVYRVCAAGPDHVHVVLDIDSAIHGEQARRLLKRWVGQELSAKWPLVKGQSWWAEEGSNLAIKDLRYLNNAFDYVQRQRTRQ